MIHFPENEMAGTRFTSPVALVDVMPAILDYIGLNKFCRDCKAHSLLGSLRGSFWGRKEYPIYSVRIDEVNRHEHWIKNRGKYQYRNSSGSMERNLE